MQSFSTKVKESKYIGQRIHSFLILQAQVGWEMSESYPQRVTMTVSIGKLEQITILITIIMYGFG